MKRITYKQYLMESGIKQSALARELGVSDALLSHLKNGYPVAPKTLDRINEYFAPLGYEIISEEVDRYNSCKRKYNAIREANLVLEEEIKHLKKVIAFYQRGEEAIINFAKKLEKKNAKKPFEE